MNDKQSAELAAGVARQAELAASEAATEGSPDVAGEDSSTEDISMEDVLGAGTRRKAAARGSLCTFGNRTKSVRRCLPCASLVAISEDPTVDPRNPP